MVIRLLLQFAHDATLALWFGGSWMGAVGLNGASIEVDDPTQRLRVADAGWFRWAPVVGASIIVHVASAAALGRVLPRAGTPRRVVQVVGVSDDGAPALRWLRVGVTLAAMLATAGTGIWGQRVVAAGDVPVSNAVTPIAATPPEVALAQRRLRLAQWAVPALTAPLWVIDGLQRRRAGG